MQENNIQEKILNKLNELYDKYKNYKNLLEDSNIVTNLENVKKYTKEISALEPTILIYIDYIKNNNKIINLKNEIQIESDNSIKDLINEEINELTQTNENLFNLLKQHLIQTDEDDNKNIVLEIRAGAGGDEASLFAYELYKMYSKYAEKHNWKVEETSSSLNELGGIKEVIALISGKDVYGKLKFESGVHRVQRVPKTEVMGRVHTSTVTVAILPEIEDININIDEKDLKIETIRSSGAGGQHVNKTESCVRITHIPTGIIAICQDERSQIRNKEKAMKVLKSRLYNLYKNERDQNYSNNRKKQVGTGDRSEKIRTYNFPQKRITDHRINYSIYTINEFMDGDLDCIINKLIENHNENKLLNL